MWSEGYGGNFRTTDLHSKVGRECAENTCELCFEANTLMPNFEQIRTRASKVVPNRCKFRH